MFKNNSDFINSLWQRQLTEITWLDLYRNDIRLNIGIVYVIHIPSYLSKVTTRALVSLIPTTHRPHPRGQTHMSAFPQIPRHICLNHHSIFPIVYLNITLLDPPVQSSPGLCIPPPPPLSYNPSTNLFYPPCNYECLKPALFLSFSTTVIYSIAVSFNKCTLLKGM